MVKTDHNPASIVALVAVACGFAFASSVLYFEIISLGVLIDGLEKLARQDASYFRACGNRAGSALLISEVSGLALLMYAFRRNVWRALLIVVSLKLGQLILFASLLSNNAHHYLLQSMESLAEMARVCLCGSR